MDSKQSSQISALFDGEVEAHEVRAAIRASLDDAERWRVYGLIRDGLRGEAVPNADLTARVMTRLAAEPIVLAPANLKRPHRPPAWLALAASLAGVAVVAWMAWSAGQPERAAREALLAQRSPAASQAPAVSPAPTLPTAPALVAENDLREYLLAHHAQAMTLRPADSARQVRTVSLSAAHP